MTTNPILRSVPGTKITPQTHNKQIYVIPGIEPGTLRVTAKHCSSELYNKVANYEPTACNTVHPWCSWGGGASGVSPQNVCVCRPTPILIGSTKKCKTVYPGPPVHHHLYRYMADDGEPWDPEALERLLRLEADLASLLAFLAPHGPSGDNGPPKPPAGPSSNLDRS